MSKMGLFDMLPMTERAGCRKIFLIVTPSYVILHSLDKSFVEWSRVA